MPLQELVQQHGSLEDEDTDDLDDDMLMMDESPDMDDEGSESGDRVIYPWMKKIHVAGVGEFKFFIYHHVTAMFETNLFITLNVTKNFLKQKCLLKLFALLIKTLNIILKTKEKN